MSAEFNNPFTPNTAIQLADITELPPFEDIVAQVVDPDMTPAEKLAWDGRMHIRELIGAPKFRGKRFNGRITDIELTPLEDAYDRLQTAREDGWQLSARGGGGRIASTVAEADEQLRTERCVGFHLAANAKSSGRGVIGEIQVGLWYLPVTRKTGIERWNSAKRTSWNGGRSVVRVVTRPKLEVENFIRLHDESRRIALSALKAAVENPYRINKK
ncbi:MAG TPA: hypothetical protein VLG11_00100 [Candidatus Saccharimonadales bacterium]|nr:hypothetical protein [Candidatus Saccharimonadales bacterium]